MAKLIVVDGPDLGNEYDLSNGDGASPAVVMGRDPRAGVALTDSAVSREHCKIEVTRKGFRVIDLGSRNRTYLNSEPVEESWLRNGDVLNIGDSELRFEDDSPPLEAGGAATTIVKELRSETRDSSQLLDRVERVDGVENGDGLEKSLRRLRRVLKLARDVAGTCSVSELFDKLLNELLAVTDADHAAFLVNDGKRWTIRAQAARTETSPGAVKASLSVVERAARDRKAILSASTEADERFQDKQSVIREEIHSALAVPVLQNDVVSGVLYVDRRRDREPFDEDSLELVRAVAEPVGAILGRLENQDRLVDENRNLMRSISEQRRIIGNSEAVRGVLDFIRRAAPTTMTVLIEGETGTGKELVASAIHYSSPRRGRPFVALNCAALPENLVESELFGHERGAFTGAVARKKGRFELASGGTVFLDEVGELTLACQAKLLRLLEERRFERVGGAESVEVDVRILAATNKSLLDAVGAGEFREDLYYRLSVLNVQIPPLRERLDDIRLLVDHFLSLQAAAGRPKKLSKSAATKLLRYSWPGNVRQLRNVIESAVVLGEGNDIKPDDLVLPDKAPRSGKGDWQPISLQELEREHILKVLDHTRGNKKRAAEILGIERCTLYSKLKNYED